MLVVIGVAVSNHIGYNHRHHYQNIEHHSNHNPNNIPGPGRVRVTPCSNMVTIHPGSVHLCGG